MNGIGKTALALHVSLCAGVVAIAGAQAKPAKDSAKRAPPPPPMVVRKPSQPPPPTVIQPSKQPPPPTVVRPASPPPPPSVVRPSEQPPPPTVVRPSHQPPPPTVIRPSTQPPPPTVVRPASPRPPTVARPSEQPPPPTLVRPSKQPPPPTVVEQEQPPPPPTVIDEQPPPPTVVREGARPAGKAVALRIRSVKYDPRGGMLVLSLLVNEYVMKTAASDLYLALHMRVRDAGGKTGIIAPNFLPLANLRHYNSGEPGLIGVVVPLPWDGRDVKGDFLTGSAQAGFKAELVRLTNGRRAFVGATAGRVQVLLPAP